MGPGDLEDIIQYLPREDHPDLMVGFHLADDAGVFRLSDETALIQTLDFITPIVNDPFQFGMIAAVNALSDVYAMGGRPITAMNIVCFPTKNMDKNILIQILKGGFEKVHEAGAALVGGHTVDDLELKYGLSVTGVVAPDRVISNSGAKPGQALILTKPLGTGIVATAIKGNMASADDEAEMIESMITLNRFGEEAARFGIKGGTDISGFGLLGHAGEIARASQAGLIIESEKVPVFSRAMEFAAMGLVPAGSWANQKFCSKSLQVASNVPEERLNLLADAQTSSGLLLAVSPEKVDDVLASLHSHNAPQAAVIGRVTEGPPGNIEVV
ncbi:MAG: selenide, water dikinase SelD [Deltaproteobacteria bacterium]|nr:selenide, water dikinase SelD [Deltaproteobacteria bacterium]MBW2051643.1 selenide, water dikinase SelD [Deltaproteobacteria bacterium]MBW2141326.1 selenide, water dikinase SelD [Deltaproteobacteria bacterium]MBW2322402.1 selenide, water dikinase SelD [Deltaproteobacteria bacterium]